MSAPTWILPSGITVPVVQERFQLLRLVGSSKRGRYPTQRNELIPANLTALPNARNTLVARHFGYDGTRPTLYFPAMFHGVFYYDFQSDRWTTND